MALPINRLLARLSSVAQLPIARHPANSGSLMVRHADPMSIKIM